MKSILARLVREQKGQDVTEYSLLLAFVVVCSAAFYLLSADSIRAILTVTSDTLSSANSMSS